MRQFIKQHRRNLIAADAANLDLRDESQDFVFSHLLINNLPFEKGKSVIDESIRILVVGGEARFGFVMISHAHLLKEYIEESFGDYIAVELKVKGDSEFTSWSRPKEYEKYVLLKIKKHKKI